MRFINLTNITLAAAVASCFGMALAVKAQDEPPPVHHDQPVAPPDSLKPGAAPDEDAPTNSPMAQDRAASMGNGVDVACTGIGSARDDPQWKAWPVKVVFSNGAGQFLAGEHITLMRGHDKIGDFVCDANWVLVRGPAGDYTVTAALTGHEDKSHSAHFSPPSSGQKTVEISFPGMSANE
ncbi:MAG TPA: hypothetical protein VIJ62_09825 [Rhizomicrobium sp.]